MPRRVGIRFGVTPARLAPLAHEGLDVTEGRRRVTGFRRQSRRRAASVTVAVPPMRCIRAGRLVRGRLGVLGGRSGSTCDASVSAIGPCSQPRRHVWRRRYPLVKTLPGLSPALDEPLAMADNRPLPLGRGAGRSEDLDPVLRREGGKSGDVGWARRPPEGSSGILLRHSPRQQTARSRRAPR